MSQPNTNGTLAGGLLLDARKRAGLTQAQLAERSGVIRPLISQYETGRKDPSVAQLARLISACGMELRMRADVLTGQDRSQYAHDAVAVRSGAARRNSERARREIVSVRPPTAEEMEWLRGGHRAAS